MSDTTTGSGAGKLRGSIGVVGIVFLVIAAAAPLTAIGGALPVMIAIGNGAGAPTAYLIAALVLLVFSVGYAAMSSHMVDTGAFYAYVAKGLGESCGLGAAGLALLTYTAIQAAVYGLAAATIQGLVVQYGGPDLPWWMWALVLIALVAVLGYRSIDSAPRSSGFSSCSRSASSWRCRSACWCGAGPRVSTSRRSPRRRSSADPPVSH